MKKRFFLSAFMLIQIFILLGISTYAWFADKSNPNIAQDNIRVTSAEGLHIKLSLDSENRTTVNLNELFYDYNQFEIKQVSSADGKNFYTIDFGAGISYNNPRYVKVIPNEYGKIDMVEYGYIDYDFYLQTEDFGKHVYFHKDTYLNGIGANAMRVALTYTLSDNEYIMIFGKTAENGINNTPWTTKAVIGEGEFQYNTINPLLTSNQNVMTFDDKNGGRGTNDSDLIDLSKILFTIPSNTLMKLNMKVWLEGGDIDCDNTLADTTIDLNIKFGSANELLDPPVLSVNNQFRTINGLTTAMEYSYSSAADETFTQVSNPSMVFPEHSTVYVRYSEVPGVSPMSHTAVLTFN